MRFHRRLRSAEEAAPAAVTKHALRPCLALTLLLTLPTLAQPAPPPLPFTDVTKASGITFVHDNAGSAKKYLPETMGGGVAFLDYDRDGDADLLLLHSSLTAAPPAVLYANDGEGNFTDVTEKSGLAAAVPKGFLGMGVAAADADGDGWTDLYLTAVGRNRFLRNADGRFTDATAESGLAGPEDAWGTGAAFFDADGDGDLDLVVVNYLRWSKAIDDAADFRLDGLGRAYGLPPAYDGADPLFFRNRGDGTFEEVGAEAGLRVAASPDGPPLAKALAVAVEDVDRDGYPDVFVANDTERNLLFHNQGDGSFEEVGELWGLAYSPDGKDTGAMGVDFGHLPISGEGDGAGRLAYLVGNFAKEVTSLYRAGDDGAFFVDEALRRGLGAATRMPLTFAVLLFDADLDGRPDLLQVNGHVEPGIAEADPAQSYRQPTQLFWNAGDRFVQAPDETLGDLPRPLAGRGAAYADVDGDGDLDLALTQIAGPAVLLRNDQDTGHHWLRLRLEGRPPNTDAIGARVELTAGGRSQHRTVQPTRGYLSHVELALTFGLGKTGEVDEVTIIWPDGTEQTLSGENLPVGRTHTLRQPSPPRP